MWKYFCVSPPICFPHLSVFLTLFRVFFLSLSFSCFLYYYFFNSVSDLFGFYCTIFWKHIIKSYGGKQRISSKRIIYLLTFIKCFMEMQVPTAPQAEDSRIWEPLLSVSWLLSKTWLDEVNHIYCCFSSALHHNSNDSSVSLEHG